MKILLLTCVGAGLLGALQLLPCCDRDETCAGPRGAYLEARTLTVFGGACHINAESASQGRGALMAWSFEGGAWEGTDLAGVRALAQVRGAGNLAEGGPRRSVLRVDAESEAQRAAARAWLTATHGRALGTVECVQPAAIDFERDGDHFRLAASGLLLEGQALADRRCCTMPENRWYEPLARRVASVVGFARHCRVAAAGTQDPWTYEGANNVFVGTFGGPGGGGS